MSSPLSHLPEMLPTRVSEPDCRAAAQSVAAGVMKPEAGGGYYHNPGDTRETIETVVMPEYVRCFLRRQHHNTEII